MYPYRPAMLIRNSVTGINQNDCEVGFLENHGNQWIMAGTINRRKSTSEISELYFYPNFVDCGFWMIGAKDLTF